MKTKAQIINDIDQLNSYIQQNRQSSSQFIAPYYNREILTIKDQFVTIADNLSSEFTEQELYTIENSLLFCYQTLKEIIDIINLRFKTQNPIRFTNQQYNNYYSPYVTNDVVESSIIQQKDIDQYTTYIQRRIAGIIEEIEKKQKMQLRHIAEIYNLYNGLADNLDQQMMAMDEQLYVRQTQRHDATIKNIIDVLDGV